MSFDPWTIISGVLIGMVGMFMFMRGKRDVNIPCLVTGAALCVYPYFVSSLLLTWGIFALCMGGWYYLAKHDTMGA